MGFTSGTSIDKQEKKHFKSVEKYVEKKSNRMRYTVAVDNAKQIVKNAWHKAAGLGGIPKVFLVDKQGRIAYIGNYKREFEKLVDDVINDRHSMEELIKVAREKEAKTTPYDRTQPLLIDGNGGKDTAFVFRSLLAKFRGNIKTGASTFISGNRKMIQEIGLGLPNLYMLAYGDTIFPYPMYYPNSYGKYWKEPILEINDTSAFVFDYKKSQNRWNYSLIVPKKKSAKSLQRMMQRDLKNYFEYDVSVETRKMPCWILTASRKAKKTLKAKNPGKEYSFKTNDLMITTITNTNMKNMINLLWKKNQLEPPFVDNTGIEGEFDIELKGDVEKLEDMITALKENGLILKKGVWDMKVVVIRDARY